MKYDFAPAASGEIAAVFSPYEKRVRWMDEQGIRQWNVTDYLNVYPQAYYRRQAEMGSLYVLKETESGTIVGAAVLLQEDERWADRGGIPAYYVHNLVTDPAAKGAGAEMLRAVEGLAMKQGRQALRLDCAADNVFLNRYYESMGFMPAGYCEEGAYRGIRREKKL